jgi:hypothetical protein
MHNEQTRPLLPSLIKTHLRQRLETVSLRPSREKANSIRIIWRPTDTGGESAPWFHDISQRDGTSYGVREASGCGPVI